jgi:hypothetical protein
MKSRSLVIMSETNDPSKLGDAKLENRVLADTK